MSLHTLRRKPRGSVLLYALVVLLVGAVVLAGWVSLMGSRVIYNEGRETTINQRITLENSRALASQYLLQNVLPLSFHTAPAFNFAALGGWGSFTLSNAGSTETPLESITIQRPVNHFAPGDGSGYTVDIPATLSDGTNNYNWLFSAKSRCPIFSTDLFTAQKPTISAGGAVHVSTGVSVGGTTAGGANVVLWLPDGPSSYNSPETRSYQTPTVILPSATIYDTGGNALIMSDFAFIPVTSGISGTDYGYDGSISVVNPGGTTSPNSLYSHVTASSCVLVPSGSAVSVPGVTSDGSGHVTINLSGTSISDVYIAGSTGTITLQGQSSPGDATADSLSALLIVYTQDITTTHDLTSIVLQGYNNRRVYLGVKKSNGTAVSVTLTSATSPAAWRLGGTFENTPLNFTLAGSTLAITGGFRTDQSVTISSGALQISHETNPELLESFADRIVWLEAFRQ